MLRLSTSSFFSKKTWKNADIILYKKWINKIYVSICSSLYFLIHYQELPICDQLIRHMFWIYEVKLGAHTLATLSAGLGISHKHVVSTTQYEKKYISFLKIQCWKYLHTKPQRSKPNSYCQSHAHIPVIMYFLWSFWRRWRPSSLAKRNERLNGFLGSALLHPSPLPSPLPFHLMVVRRCKHRTGE